MQTALALIRDEKPKKAEESGLQYDDRTELAAYWKLHSLKKRTKAEDAEFSALEKKVTGRFALENADFPTFFLESDIRPAVERVHRELTEEFGSDTPQKKLLTQRLASVWGQAWSYERLFQILKYRKTDTGGFSIDCSSERIRALAEARKGIESTNDQILRLTQALQNISSPPIQVKAKNAIIAQNMQINQGSAATPDAKTNSGTL